MLLFLRKTGVVLLILHLTLKPVGATATTASGNTVNGSGADVVELSEAETPVSASGSLVREEEENTEQVFQTDLEEQTASGSVNLQQTGSTVTTGGSGSDAVNTEQNTPDSSSGTIVEENDALKISLNEIMVAPSEGKEWVELYNGENKTVDLSGWSLSDTVSERYIFPEVTQIEAGGFIVVEFYNIFNNAGDGVSLKNVGGNLVDFWEYGTGTNFAEIPKDHTAGRAPDGSENWSVYAEDETTRGGSNLTYYNVELSEIQADIAPNSGSVILSWDAVDEVQFAYYQLWEKRADSGFVLLNEITENYLKIDERKQGEVYAYRLKACNVEGNCTNTESSRNVLITDFLGLNLNEFLANAPGSDTNQEWIELHYQGSGGLALEDFYLEIDTSKKIELDSFGEIESGSFLLINPADFEVTLKNSNGKIALFQHDFDAPLEEIAYAVAHENKSWRRHVDTQIWEENYHPTPGETNQLQNTSPKAFLQIQGSGKTQGEGSLSVNVTAEKSYDADGDTLTCFWDFGDGTTAQTCNPGTHQYGVGDFEIHLTVQDILGAQDKATQQVKVTASPGGTSVLSRQPESTKLAKNYSDKIRINEIYPNPEGKDEDKEWVELKNTGKETVCLDWWRLDDEEGGSKPYVIPTNTCLEASEFWVITIQKSKISFKNSTDTVRLLAPNDKEKDRVNYRNAQEGKSYQRQTGGGWKWLESTRKAENRTADEISADSVGDRHAYPLPEEEKAPPPIPVYDYSLIQINEFLPSTSQGDKEYEWIEIQNTGTQTLSLWGWSLDDEVGKGSKPYFFSEKDEIAPKGYFLIYSKDSGLALNNGGDRVNLINPLGEIESDVVYESCKKDHSWAKNSRGQFLVSRFSTPGEDNILAPAQSKQDADGDGLSDEAEKLHLTASDNSDTDDDGMPDGFEVRNGLNPLEPEKTNLYRDYLQRSTTAEIEGTQKGNLLIAGKAEANALVKVFVHSKLVIGTVKADAEGNWEYLVAESLETGSHHVETQIVTETGVRTERQTVLEFSLDEEYVPQLDSVKVKLEKILPNPEGKDQEKEYFALKNFDSKPVNLKGWLVLNQQNKKHVFGNFWLNPGDERQFYYQDTKLTLNNKKGFLMLLNSQGRRTDFLDYSEVREGEVFTHSGGSLNSGNTERKKKDKEIKHKEKIYAEKTEIKGLVLSEIIEQQNSFWFKTDSNQEIRIEFSTKEYPLFVAKQVFAKGNQLLILGEFTEEASFLAEDFVLLKQASAFMFRLPQISLNRTDVVYWLILLMGSCYLGTMLWRKKNVAIRSGEI